MVGADREDGAGGFDLALVAHLSRLARLGLTDAEMAAILPQLQAILAAVDRLREADVSGVDPTAQVGGLYDVMRDDQVEPSLSTDEALANAPSREAGLLRVPAIQ
ncbi:MAG: Asp-tRNA(Asn)/Glu-tRNA(Gln) amidotransferase subunit GatC [Candidatus Dormibacteria bacterium]